MQKDDVIYRQAAIDAVNKNRDSVFHDNVHYEDTVYDISNLPSALPEIAEKLHRFKCCITDKKGFHHEVIYIDDIRRATGWEI